MPRYRGSTTNKCGEMDLNFFSRDVALYHFISGVTDLISSKRSDYYAMLRENLLSAHQWNKRAE